MMDTNEGTSSPYNPDPHAHPGLHAIAIIGMAKGALALIAASGLEIIGPAPIQRALHALTQHFHLDPASGIAGWLASVINPTGIHIAAGIAAMYGLLHLIEGGAPRPGRRGWAARLRRRTCPSISPPSCTIAIGWKRQRSRSTC